MNLNHFLKQLQKKETLYLKMPSADLSSLSDADLFYAVTIRTENKVDACHDLQEGLAALNESGYAAELRALIRKERAWLYAALRSLGLRVIGGEANYLLFYTDYTVLHEALRRRGILIRSCANFSGLGEGWYRVAVRTHEENEQLIAAIGEEAAQWQNA